MPGCVLPGRPSDVGDMGLTPSRSGGVKYLGLICLSWLCGLTG